MGTALAPKSSSPRSSSPSASLDSDNDTDLDSSTVDILDQQHYLSPSDHFRPTQQQHFQRHSLLVADKQTYLHVEPLDRLTSASQADEKYYFDEFWDNFHRKRKRRSGLPALDTYNDSGCSFDGTMNGRRRSYNARAYELPHQRPTLVQFVKNGWQAQNTHSGWSSPTELAPSWTQILSAPRIRRWIIIVLVSVSLLWLYWRRYWMDAWTEHRTLGDAVNGRLRSDLGYFGTNMLPEFVGMTQLKTLDTSFVPGPKDSKRLIFIGDIHGCHEEFSSLLSELSFNPVADHLVLTGDLISKGPSSSAAVDLAIASNASCVRGNHEDRVLLAYRDLQYHHRLAPHTDRHAKGEKVPTPPNPGNPNAAKETEPDVEPDQWIDAEHFTSGDFVDQQLARSLSKQQINYLALCPVILDVGPVKDMGRVRAVHAGLVPGVSLQRQDPLSVMHMRTLDLKSHVPSRGATGTPWTKIWNRYQSVLPKRERTTVIYGHDSHRGLQLEKYSKGLDTGCVKGGQLTALVISSGPSPQIVSVNCKDYRPNRASTEELGSS